MSLPSSTKNSSRLAVTMNLSWKLRWRTRHNLSMGVLDSRNMAILARHLLHILLVLLNRISDISVLSPKVCALRCLFSLSCLLIMTSRDATLAAECICILRRRANDAIPPCFSFSKPGCLCPACAAAAPPRVLSARAPPAAVYIRSPARTGHVGVRLTR